MSENLVFLSQERKLLILTLLLDLAIKFTKHEQTIYKAQENKNITQEKFNGFSR